MNKWELSRRSLLTHLGVGAACLPLLRATKSYAQAPQFPLRFLCHLQTEGYQMAFWAPDSGPLAGQKLPDSTSPLEEFKSDLIIMSGLTNPKFPGCAKWGHGTYGQIFTGGAVDPNSGNGKEYWEPMIPSVDQVVAQQMLKTAPQLSMPSLALEVKVGSGSFPGSKRCFWSGPKQPVTPEPDCYRVYNQIFAGKPSTPGMPDDPAAGRLIAERKSLLDFVGGDLEKFKNQLGTEDRLVIDGHLQSIRDIEKQLTAPKVSIAGCGKWSGDPAKPLDIKANANVPLVLPLQFSLLISALKCDITRVGTMQFGDATGGAIIFDFVPGVPTMGNGYQKFRDWHDLGHRPIRGTINDKQIVDKWTMTRFAEVLRMIKSVPEGDGTMLDNMAFLWANHMESGDNHGTQKLPWILAGKAGGYFKTGQAFKDVAKPMNGVLTEICNAMGVKTPFFGDQAVGGPMPELRAT
jgi:hypothetical protein